eukprot:1909630-Pyramimonas_sp.AAC.1
MHLAGRLLGRVASRQLLRPSSVEDLFVASIRVVRHMSPHDAWRLLRCASRDGACKSRARSHSALAVAVRSQGDLNSV